MRIIILGDLDFKANHLLKQGFKLMDITTKHKSELPYHHSKNMRERKIYKPNYYNKDLENL